MASIVPCLLYRYHVLRLIATVSLVGKLAGKAGVDYRAPYFLISQTFLDFVVFMLTLCIYVVK